MNKNKTILTVFLALAVFMGSGFLIWFLPVHNETIDIIKTWRDFGSMVSEGQVSEAVQKYINFEDEQYADRMYLKYENEKIIYSSIDITDNIPKWKCRYWGTLFDHYWKRYEEYDKVNFETGYALLKNEKVVYIKIP